MIEDTSKISIVVHRFDEFAQIDILFPDLFSILREQTNSIDCKAQKDGCSRNHWAVSSTDPIEEPLRNSDAGKLSRANRSISKAPKRISMEDL